MKAFYKKYDFPLSRQMFPVTGKRVEILFPGNQAVALQLW